MANNIRDKQKSVLGWDKEQGEDANF